MSDRASNEKLANTLLNEWRDEMLLNFELNGDKQTVHSFHCMAHVLLGFHSYVKPELKQLETKLVEVHGPIGRDSLSAFKFWSKKELVIERVLRTTADVFGPVGDHHGVRDRWESHCSSLGIKSLIGNYKDNRFNALFETAAEVFKHKEDFLVVLDTVKNQNLKLKSVKEDLKSTIVSAMLQCFGLFYLKLTGPYWNLITCGKVAYLELYPHVIAIKSFLENCVEDPALMLNQDCHWSAEDPLQIHIVPHYDIYVASLFTLQEENRQLLFDLIKLVAANMIKCVDKQLVDFLPGGKFYSADTGNELNRTKFAHVTNLACEHHFGDLDSSQRRRPSASMHHHSSVQLLKRNRKDMMHWIQNMPSAERSTMIKDAIKGGRTLREIHMNNEKSVIAEVHDEMMQPVIPKRQERKREPEFRTRRRGRLR
ncbi:unnamed protein product [Mytilus coruscus]|uniref:Uncharacterized protein n=1 Tax=Mytilus coruscus TaxID=42192 RepID=A0A6J8A066_MYTCO|nr:unnamed protein product [Mytilus coruscus]